MRLAFLIFASLVFSGCGITFGTSVREANGDEFLKACDVQFVDNSHFEYHSDKPSIIFIYSDVVEHCRRQAAVYNKVSELYGDQIYFWAVQERDANSILSNFGYSGKLPVYLFINQNIAQELTLNKITVPQMQGFIAQHFGITPKPRKKSAE